MGFPGSGWKLLLVCTTAPPLSLWSLAGCVTRGGRKADYQLALARTGCSPFTPPENFLSLLFEGSRCALLSGVRGCACLLLMPACSSRQGSASAMFANWQSAWSPALRGSSALLVTAENQRVRWQQCSICQAALLPWAFQLPFRREAATGLMLLFGQGACCLPAAYV